MKFTYLIIISFCLCYNNGIAQTTWLAPDSAKSTHNPFLSSEEHINSGRDIYMVACAPCHGEKGKGDGPASTSLDPKPANHTSAKVQDMSDGEIFWKIKTGKGSMPTWDGVYPDEEYWKVIHFIRTLKSSDPAFDDSNLSNTDTLTKSIKNEIASPNRKFLFTGSAVLNSIAHTSMLDEPAFGLGFSPLFLWKPAPELFFESHLHFETEASPVESGHSGEESATGGHSESAEGGHGAADPMFMVDFANMVWFINDYITFTGGIFLSPFGIYSERFHPEWINRLPSAPLGFSHSNVLVPATETGIQFRGGLPLGEMKATYSFYLSNGPSLQNTDTNSAGKLIYNNLIDNNGNKALGTRISILPLSNSSLETGFSLQYSKPGDPKTMYENLTSLLYAIDISYLLNSKAGDFRFISQFNSVNTDKASYYKSVNNNLVKYSFDNSSTIYFIQFSYRPSYVSSVLIKNSELSFRYDKTNLPKGALWENDASQIGIGYTYWLKPRSGLKLAYFTDNNHMSDMSQIHFQFVMGF